MHPTSPRTSRRLTRSTQEPRAQTRRPRHRPPPRSSRRRQARENLEDQVFALNIKLEGVDRVAKAFADLKASVRDLRPFWKSDELRPRLLGGALDQDGRDRFGRPFEPLNPVYAAWKAKHFPGKPVLERTGRLRDSLSG